MEPEFKIIDWTDEIDLLSNKEKNFALTLIERYFDLEQVQTPSGIGHFPISELFTATGNPDEDAKVRVIVFDKLVTRLWSHVLSSMEYPKRLRLDEGSKVGKIKYTTCNKFDYVNKEDDFKLYAFEYPDHIQAEINFTIEYYK